MSGPAFTVLTTANTTNAFPAGPLRPNLVGDPELPASERTVTRWFNTAAFANPAPLTFGNSPRSVLRGPALVTTDLTVEKTIPLPGDREVRRASRDVQPAEPDEFQPARIHAGGA